MMKKKNTLILILCFGAATLAVLSQKKSRSSEVLSEISTHRVPKGDWDPRERRFHNPTLQKSVENLSTRHLHNLKQSPDQNPSKEQDLFSNQKQFELEIESARTSLSPHTLRWSEKLPKPETPAEKALWLFLQIARDDQPEVEDYILKSADQFLNANEETQDYFRRSLDVLDSGEDQRVRNFTYRLARQGFPNQPLNSHLISDWRKAQSDPAQFSDADFKTLTRIMLQAPDVDSATKVDLLNRLNQRPRSSYSNHY